MKDATDFLPNTGVGIGSILRNDQEAVKGLPRLANVKRIVMNVTQQIAEARWQFLNESWCHLIVCYAGPVQSARCGVGDVGPNDE